VENGRMDLSGKMITLLWLLELSAVFEPETQNNLLMTWKH
jgi:hypothetical protein